MREQQPPDEYLLQLRPGAAARGRIVEQTAERAAYWHRARRPRTEQDLADAARAEHDEREKLARDRWGARPPNARLRATLGAGLSLRTISALDPELEFALADVEDEVHRQVAAWAVLRSLTQAGLVDRPQLAPAVTALRRGVLVEAPFDVSGYVWSLLERMKPPRTSVPTPPDGQDEQSPQDWAIASVFHSAMSDSLAAVLEVLVCLAFVSGRDGYRQAYAEVRREFPQLAR